MVGTTDPSSLAACHGPTTPPGSGAAQQPLPPPAMQQQAQRATKKVELVGHTNFVRHNPRSDRFGVRKFHHVEFWCADATNTYKRFQHGLGMTLVAKSDHSTGNSRYASYVLRSHDLTLVFTAPYSRACAAAAPSSAEPLPGFDQQAAFDFIISHGLAVRAVGLLVDDAAAAYEASVANGATAVRPPTLLREEPDGGSSSAAAVVSEVGLYGDVVLRYVSGQWQAPFLPGYASTPDEPAICYGLQRLDHAVGNVHKLVEALEHIMGFTGFHEFAEFVAEDVGTLDSGLNSMVLASNNELVLLPINEPTFGTKRKSQIQTYLEQNEGPGLQHLALKTNDIIATITHMAARSQAGGFEFMPRPSQGYYGRAAAKLAGELSGEQLAACERYGILIDKDDQGVLLQIFTKPLGDRPTVFIEIIQRLGCTTEVQPPPADAADADAAAAGAVNGSSSGRDGRDVIEVRPDGVVVEQAAGCGGFGKGNFAELFKSIEDYERTLKV